MVNNINKITKLKKNLKNEEDMVMKDPLDRNFPRLVRETRHTIENKKKIYKSFL